MLQINKLASATALTLLLSSFNAHSVEVNLFPMLDAQQIREQTAGVEFDKVDYLKDDFAATVVKYLKQNNQTLTEFKDFDEIKVLHRIIDPLEPEYYKLFEEAFLLIIDDFIRSAIHRQLNYNGSKPTAEDHKLFEFLESINYKLRPSVDNYQIYLEPQAIFKLITFSPQAQDLLKILIATENHQMFFEGYLNVGYEDALETVAMWEQYLRREDVNEQLKAIAKSRFSYYLSYVCFGLDHLEGSPVFEDQQISSEWKKIILSYLKHHQGSYVDLLQEYYALLEKNSFKYPDESSKHEFIRKIDSALGVTTIHKSEDFPGRLSAQERQLIGQYPFSLQLFNQSQPKGQAEFRDTPKGVFLSGTQRIDKENFVMVNGRIKEITDNGFMLKNGFGIVSIKSNGQELQKCELQNRDIVFKQKDDKSGWRLDPATISCHQQPYYIDIDLN